MSDPSVLPSVTLLTLSHTTKTSANVWSHVGATKRKACQLKVNVEREERINKLFTCGNTFAIFLTKSKGRNDKETNKKLIYAFSTVVHYLFDCGWNCFVCEACCLRSNSRYLPNYKCLIILVDANKQFKAVDISNITEKQAPKSPMIGQPPQKIALNSNTTVTLPAAKNV